MLKSLTEQQHETAAVFNALTPPVSPATHVISQSSPINTIANAVTTTPLPNLVEKKVRTNSGSWPE